METITISLPKAIKAFVESQISEGGFETASDFIAQLIRDAQKRKAREKVDALLLEGLSSGEPQQVTSEFWSAERQRLEKHLYERAGKQ